MKKSALLAVALTLASFGLVCCGKGKKSTTKPTSGLTTRVFASQSVSSLTASPGIIIVNGDLDTLARASEISAGSSLGLMAISPERATVLVFDSATNSVNIINTKAEALAGTIQLPGPTISMVAHTNQTGYAAVPTAPLIGSPQGAVVVMDLVSDFITGSISVPNAQTVVSNPSGTELLAFSKSVDLIP